MGQCILSWESTGKGKGRYLPPGMTFLGDLLPCLLCSYFLCSNNWVIPETSWLFPETCFLLSSPSVNFPPFRNKSIQNEITQSIHFSPSSKWVSLKSTGPSLFSSALIKSFSSTKAMQNCCLHLLWVFHPCWTTRQYLLCNKYVGMFIYTCADFLQPAVD